MALVRLAPEPPPLRTSVTKTLSEFRRTHEEAGLSEVGGGVSCMVHELLVWALGAGQRHESQAWVGAFFPLPWPCAC
jgi:hypothetical protein